MMPNCPRAAPPPGTAGGSPASLCPAPPPLVSVGPTQTQHCPTGGGTPKHGGVQALRGMAALASPDSPEGVMVAPRPRRGRCPGLPRFLPPCTAPAPSLPPPPRALGTRFWGSPIPAALQCPGAEVGWPGGSGGPPPAWQPRAHRWQRLGSQRGGICAFAPAAHGALLGTGRSARGEAACGPATGQIRGTPGMAPPPATAGSRDAGGHGGGLGRTPRTPRGSLSPRELPAPPSLHRDTGGRWDPQHSARHW